MSSPLQVLVVEDSEADALLMIRALRSALGPTDFERADTHETFLQAIKGKPWDAVLIDYDLPRFSALAALQLLQEFRLDVPVIIVSGCIGEDVAVALMKAGASDYVLKSNLIRLAPALERELRETAGRRARRLAEAELRTSELRFRTLLNSTNDVIFTLDREQRHTGVFGRRPEHEGMEPDRFLGRSAREILGADAAQVHEAANARALGGECVLYEWSEPCGRGLRHFQTSLSPLKDEHGTVTGLVGFRREITEQKTSQAQLLMTDRMVSVGMLAAGVAHEINNPLTVIIAGVDFVRTAVSTLEPDVRSEIADPLREVDEAAEQIRQIVRDLKMFSRPDEEDRGPADVHRALESSLRMARNEIHHRARLVKNYGDVPLVEGTEARLGQVFLNLVVNAAHAISEGDAAHNEIRISTRVDQSGRVVVEVRDTGVGIAPENVGRVFDPFFTTKPVGVGTGLGLFVCHRIVTDLGGELSVESELGKGTVFRVRLSPAKPGAIFDNPPVPPLTRARRGRVLVVDDDETIVSAVRRTLEAEHEVVIHTSAQAALACLREGARFDVILCDLMMPQMTGMELHSALVEVAPDQASRIVFVTGGAFTPRARDFLEGVPNARVEKPFDSPGLRALVNDRIR